MPSEGWVRLACACGLAVALVQAGCSRSGLGVPLPAADPPGLRADGSAAQGGGGLAGSDAPGIDDGPPIGIIDGSGGQGMVSPPDAPPAIPNGPQGGLLSGNLCVGVGVTTPVIDQPAPAAPYFCGRDCAQGMGCPPGYLCWSVFAPGSLALLANGDRVAPTDLVAYQCLPVEGTCGPGQPAGTLCASCINDAECI